MNAPEPLTQDELRALGRDIADHIERVGKYTPGEICDLRASGPACVFVNTPIVDKMRQYGPLSYDAVLVPFSEMVAERVGLPGRSEVASWSDRTTALGRWSDQTDTEVVLEVLRSM